MKNNIKMFEEFCTSRNTKGTINEETTANLPNVRAEVIDYIKNNKNWKYNPQHKMSEFAFVPKKGEIGYAGFKQDSFSTYTGKPLIFSGSDDLEYCYLDKNNNFVLKHLGKKTTLPLSGGIASIKTIL